MKTWRQVITFEAKAIIVGCPLLALSASRLKLGKSPEWVQCLIGNQIDVNQWRAEEMKQSHQLNISLDVTSIACITLVTFLETVE